MSPTRAFIDVLSKTLRLLARDPLRMLAVAFCQLTLQRDEAQRRLKQILHDNPDLA